jgi:hypothetical protein
MIFWKSKAFYQMEQKKMRVIIVNQTALQWLNQLHFECMNLTMKKTELLKKLSIKKAKKKLDLVKSLNSLLKMQEALGKEYLVLD